MCVYVYKPHGMYPASLCATLQDVFFIILDVGGSVKSDKPTASPIISLDHDAAFWNGKSVPAHLLLKPENRCVWHAIDADTLSTLGLN